MATSMRPYILMAAIDFGTNYSYVAFSFRHEYEQDPSKAQMSLKAPTCALFDPNRKFHSFGYEAESNYANLAADGEAHDWFYFSRFKTTLYDKMTLKKNFDLEADGGNTLSAILVFSSCLKYLVDHLFQKFQDLKCGIERTEIRWVLTVPAIWNDAGNQFMRKAAEKAEIPGDQLLIALEPDAVAIYCQHLPIKPFQLGSKFLVLDARGDTFYMTVHEVMNGVVHKKLHKAKGGDWGGINVYKAFVDLLTDIVGSDVMQEVERNDMSDLLDLSREFESRMRAFTPNMEGRFNIKVPFALEEVYKKKRGKEINTSIASKDKYKNRISWNGNKLRIEPDIVIEFFQETCTAIVKHLENLFREPKFQDVPTIVMVGSDSELPILQHFVKTKFKQKKVIVPSEPGLAVLIGAMLFGHSFVVQNLQCNLSNSYFVVLRQSFKCTYFVR